MTTRLGNHRKLDVLDGPSVAAAAAALQMVPDNASRLLRIQRMSALGLSLPHKPDVRKLSPSAVRDLLKLNALVNDEVLGQEDPNEEVLIQSLSFYGGPYLVSPGLGDRSVEIAADLLTSVFRTESLPNGYRRSVYKLAKTSLALSDTSLSRAGLRRGEMGTRDKGRPVSVPGARRLEQLVNAVTFTWDDALQLELDRKVITQLSMNVAELNDPCTEDWVDPRLNVRPLLRHGDSFIVALPMDLLTTMRHHMLTLALDHGCLDELSWAYRSLVADRTVAFLAMLGARDVAKIEEDALFTRYQMTLDTTKKIHLVIATDALDEYDRDDPWGEWSTEELLETINHRIGDARQAEPAAEGMLHLIVNDSPGRSSFFGVTDTDPRDSILQLRSDDLRVIGESEEDVLGIWYFARALSTLRRGARVFSFGVMDEYAVYEENEKSFYLSDDNVPTSVHFTPGAGAETRSNHHVRIDRHGVVDPGQNAVIEVRRRYRDAAIPIYVTELGASVPAVVVETVQDTVFIRMPDLENDSLWRLGVLLTEAVAYWMWQILRVCPKAVTASGGPPQALTVDVWLDGQHRWLEADQPMVIDEEPVTVEGDSRRLMIRFHASFSALMRRIDNSAERVLVEKLLLHMPGDPSLPSRVDEVLDEVAPLGRKRLLYAMKPEANPLLFGSELPAARFVHGHVRAELLDSLGEWLRANRPELEVGNIPPHLRNELANSAVEFYFDQLRSTARELSEEGLVENLIERDEALQHDAAADSMRKPYYVACFGQDSLSVDELDERIRMSTDAQVANRFLIEYVAANPPQGSAPLTGSTYDMLLGLASEIIAKGMLSDALHYGLADPTLSILGSGRLGIDRVDSYYQGLSAFSTARAKSNIDKAIEMSSTAPAPAAASPRLDAKLESAALEEFEFTFADLSAILGHLADLAIAEPAGVASYDRDDLLAELSSRGSIPPERIPRLLERLVLQQGDAFDPPTPDVYPWRYNRDRSYVRRPLIVRSKGSTAQYVFGLRRVYSTLEYWHESVVSSRYQIYASSPRMKHYLGESRNRVTERFVDEVADQLAGPGRVVQRRVKKFGKLPIEVTKGQPLGDIDVLVLDTRGRRLFVIEVKDFEVARTPAELANELKKIVDGPKSTVKLHERRITWVAARRQAVLRHYGIAHEDAHRWDVVGLIIISEPLVGPLMRESSIPFLTQDAAVELVSRTGGRRKPSRAQKRSRR